MHTIAPTAAAAAAADTRKPNGTHGTAPVGIDIGLHFGSFRVASDVQGLTYAVLYICSLRHISTIPLIARGNLEPVSIVRLSLSSTARGV